MTEAVGGKEKAIFVQSIAPFVRGLVTNGKETVVELQNQVQIQGLLIAVDCYMNLTMENVRMVSPFKGLVGEFSFFFVQNKFIRLIKIPPNLHIQSTLQKEVDIATGEKRRREMQRAREKRAKFLKIKEAKRMAQTK